MHFDALAIMLKIKEDSPYCLILYPYDARKSSTFVNSEDLNLCKRQFSPCFRPSHSLRRLEMLKFGIYSP